MHIQLNGEEREVPPVADVAALVEALELPAPTILVEHNGVALRRGEWTGTKMNDGDRIEVLRIAAGG